MLLRRSIGHCTMDLAPEKVTSLKFFCECYRLVVGHGQCFRVTGSLKALMVILCANTSNKVW